MVRTKASLRLSDKPSGGSKPDKPRPISVPLREGEYTRNKPDDKPPRDKPQDTSRRDAIKAHQPKKDSD